MKTADIRVTLIDHMGSDLSVVNAARVSFDKESVWGVSASMSKVLVNEDIRLIKYLAKHNHTSPFNHAFVTFRVKAPIFVARQLVKHKFMPWNETSRRYVDSEPEFFFPTVWRRRADNVKQGSSEEDAEVNQDWIKKQVKFQLSAYEALLDDGVCPEQARMVLPQNMMTEWIWSGSLGAVADMCKLRLDPHSQEESRQVARCIANEMSKLYPVSWNALVEGL